MSNSHYLSMSEAAKLAGRAKSTISKALKSGKMSYVSHDPVSKAYQIDPAEVLRVFPKKQERGFDDRLETAANSAGKTLGNSVLNIELEAMRERLAVVERERERERDLLTDQIEDLRKRLDTADAARERLTAQLTDQRAVTTVSKRGLWERLTGRGAG